MNTSLGANLSLYILYMRSFLFHPQGYMYRKDAPAEATVPHNIIGRTRRRRSIHAIFVNFDVPEVPKRAREMALKLLQVKFLEEQHLASVRKVF